MGISVINYMMFFRSRSTVMDFGYIGGSLAAATGVRCGHWHMLLLCNEERLVP